MTPRPHARRWDGPAIGALAIGAAGVMVFAAFWLTLPSPLVLPLFSVFAVAAAALFALTAWLAPSTGAGRLTYFDVAGALTLIGVCAALLSDPEQALPLFEAQGVRLAGASH